MADIASQAIKRQDDPASGLGKPLEAGRVSERESEQIVIVCASRCVTVRGATTIPGGAGPDELRQGTWRCSAHSAACPTHAMTSKSNSMLGQGQPAFFFWAVGAAKLRTGSVETAPDLQGADGNATLFRVVCNPGTR